MVVGVGEAAASANRPTVFISHASQDAAVATAVVAALERAGLACWIAPRDVVPGALYAGEIVRAINECSLVVLVLSANSVASPHVGKELERASSKRKRIIALRTDAAALPHAFEYFLSESQWIEVGAGGIEPAATKLTEAVRRHLGGEPVIEAGVVPAAHATHSQVSTRRWHGMSVGVIAIAVLTVLLIAGGIQWALKRGGSAQSPATSGHTAQAGVSLAVLPFVNLSSDPEQEYFSDGLTEELLNQLAQIRNLRLTARTSSFAFKGKNEDVRVIGQKLGVANLLEGSIRKDGTQLRITAQLINIKDGTHLWSQTYDRELAKVFELQEEIARDVAQALSIKLDVGDMSRANGGTTNLEAFDKYLRAQALLLQLNWRDSRAFYREAVKLDPGFVRAWYGLATILGDIDEHDRAVAYQRLEVLAPDSWWTQSVRARQFRSQRKWLDAEMAARMALEAAPAAEIVPAGMHARIIKSVGRVNEALGYLQSGARANPLGLGSCTNVTSALDAAGRFQEAQTEYERCKGLEGAHAPSDGEALFRLWSRKDATPAAVKAQFLVFLQNDTPERQLHQRMFDHLGDVAAARAALHEAFENPLGQNVIWTRYVAKYADHYGDKDLALAALRRARVDLKDEAADDLWWPYKTNLRADPRFKEIVRDIGLVDYWRTTGKWGDFCKPVGTDDFECH